MFYDELLDGNLDMEEQKIYIMKRSGERVIFNKDKIINAIRKANLEEGILSQRLADDQIVDIANAIEKDARNASRDLSVEEIQDKVEDALMETGKHKVARLYITYRYKHNEMRKMSNIDQKISGVVERDNEEVKQENSNKNPTVLSVQRDYMAGEWSRYYTSRYLLPDDIVTAHKEGVIHFHDADYFAQHMHNCCLVNLGDMLDNGTCISGTHIDTPRSFSTACTVASQIVAQVASSQYGGQTITMSHLARYVDVSRQKIAKRLRGEFEKAGIEVDEQAPFVTVFLYLNEVPEGQTRSDLAMIIEVMFKQRILGVKDRKGLYITPAFPKLIYVLQEDNITEDSKYFYLTELAAECTAKRMVPDYISEKKAMELKGDCYPCMGCRSFLTTDRFTDAGIGNVANALNFKEGKHKYYGRFNQGVVTINLVDAACSSGGDEDKFWEIMKDRLDLCHKALRIRHERLLGTPSDVAPILWQDGALARLKPGETLDKLLFDGYSTISLGYAGLAECVYYMKGVSHTSEEGEWKKSENIDYSVYGTPLESTTYKFAKCLQRRFGKIPHVTDKNYITNSYHVHVTEHIDAFTKLSKESEFQKLSPGGAVSYVEVPNMQNNIPAVLTVIKHMYNTILYAELNTKSDMCDACGFNGEIKIVKDDTGKLVWECPNCGNRDQNKMHVSRRTCGYIGTQYWNQGRTAEISDRVLHL